MRIIDDPILLYTMLREWFNHLKPLYISLNSLIDKDKLSVLDRKNLTDIMREAGNSCQKLIDFEEEIRYQFETLVNEVSVLKQKKFELSIEIDDFEIKQAELASKNKTLKESVDESSAHLKNTIEKLKGLNSQEAELVDKIEQKKDEETQLDKLIEDKKALLEETLPLVSMNNLPEDTQQQIEGDITFDQDENMVSGNLFLSSRLEIMNIVLSVLDELIPNLKQIWNVIRELLECSDKNVIDDKIASIADLVPDNYKACSDIDESTDEVKQDEKANQYEELQQNDETEEQIETTGGDDISITIAAGEDKDSDQLLNKLSFLNLECKAREQKASDLLSKIELRNIALSKLEEYLEVVRNDVALLENKYNDTAEKIKTLSLTDKNSELLQLVVPFDKEFYFEEYQKKLFSFYENEKHKIGNLIDKSYDKLKNNERLLSLKQKELSIIDERIKKEFPNYELQLANLRLKLGNKDKEIESLNSSIKEYIEKVKLRDIELKNQLENNKEVQDSFANEKELLLQKIISLENENKKHAEGTNNIKELFEEAQAECAGYKSKIDELKNQIDELTVLKTEKASLPEEATNVIEESSVDGGFDESFVTELQQEAVKTTAVELEEQPEVSDTAALSGEEELADLQNQPAEEGYNDFAEADQTTQQEPTAVIEEKINVPDNTELDKIRTELSEQIRKRNDAEKALLEIEKLNVSLTSQITKRDSLIRQYEEEIQELKEKLNASTENVP